MNTYHLKRYALSRQPSVVLSREEFDDLLVARRRSLEHLAVEELFDVAMNNYEEFERELLSLALRSGTFMGSFRRWIDAVDAVQLVARRFANLLTTTHAYCDQLAHSISTLFGRNSPELSHVGELFREQHSTTLGYRVCAELRKHAQHRGAAVHQLYQHASWVTRPDGSKVHVHWIVPQVNVSRLDEDRSVKPSVLAELKTGAMDTPNGHQFQDLRPYIRSYLGSLGAIHLQIRQLIAASAAASDARVLGAMERFVSTCGIEALGLSAVELNERGLIEDRHPTFIMREPIDRRRVLEERNHSPTRFDTQVITNEIL